MKDGSVRRAIKRVALIRYLIDLWITRWILRARGEPRYRLVGACGGCGRCCETPAIQVSRLVFHVRPLRLLTLLWHWFVNGFKYAGENRQHRYFIFRCTHHDPATRQCDSYESRPGMCRDYPRHLLYSALPEFHEECGYSAIYKKAAQLRRALEEANLPPEKVNELAKKLHLGD